MPAILDAKFKFRGKNEKLSVKDIQLKKDSILYKHLSDKNRKTYGKKILNKHEWNDDIMTNILNNHYSDNEIMRLNSQEKKELLNFHFNGIFEFL